MKYDKSLLFPLIAFPFGQRPLVPELRSPTRSLSSLLFIHFIQKALDFARTVVPAKTRTTVVTLLDGSVVAP